MSRPYKLLPGTILHSAIEYLKTQPQGTELSSAAIGEAVGQGVNGITQYLTPGVNAGLLRKRLSGSFALWSLGSTSDSTLPPEEPSPEERDAEPVRSVSALAVNSVFAYAADRGAAPFSVALSTDGRLTAERHGRVIAEFTDTERRVLLQAATEGVTPC